jgi:predicted  nucleic acid-binding Zn-ribbon protein
MLEKQNDLKDTVEHGFTDLKDTVVHGFTDLKDTMERGFTDLKEEHIKTRNISLEIFHSEVQELRQEINFLRSSIEEIRKKVGIT